jgi:hypothetical protein
MLKRTQCLLSLALVVLIASVTSPSWAQDKSVPAGKPIAVVGMYVCNDEAAAIEVAKAHVAGIWKDVAVIKMKEGVCKMADGYVTYTGTRWSDAGWRVVSLTDPSGRVWLEVTDWALGSTPVVFQ